MFFNASARVAMITGEAEREDFTGRAEQAPVRYTSPLAIYEAVLSVARIRNAPVCGTGMVAATAVEIMPITPRDRQPRGSCVFTRYGRGNHPARLNMGDCFA